MHITMKSKITNILAIILVALLVLAPTEARRSSPSMTPPNKNNEQDVAVLENTMMRSVDLPVFGIRVVCVVGGSLLHSHDFWKGTDLAPPKAFFALHELLYYGMRVAFAYRTPTSGSTFTAEKRKAAPKLPPWIVVVQSLSLLLNMFANPALFLAPHLVSFAALPVIRTTATTVGASFAVLGLGLQLLSHLHLGENWSTLIETKKQHKLVMNGVYSRVRHPMYTAFLFNAVGGAFLCANFLVGVSTLLVVLATIGRIPTEEAMLKAEFGAEYEAYRARSGALLPRLRRTKME